jgi:hypothetical protein
MASPPQIIRGCPDYSCSLTRFDRREIFISAERELMGGGSHNGRGDDDEC